MAQNLLQSLKQYKPLTNKVLVRRHELDERLGSGILFAPDTMITRNILCTVIVSGMISCPGGKKVPSDIKPGDVVYLRQWSGDAIDSINDPMVLNTPYELIEAVKTDGIPDQKAMELVEQIAGLKGILIPLAGIDA